MWHGTNDIKRQVGKNAARLEFLRHISTVASVNQTRSARVPVNGSNGKSFPSFTPSRSGLAHEPVPPIVEWQIEIRKVWHRGAEDTLGLARILSQAREALREHGQWSELWRGNGLPFGKRQAERLALIGKSLKEASASVLTHLPRAAGALYYLAQLGLPLVKQLVAEGRIHPEMGSRKAKALLALYHPEAVDVPARGLFQEVIARFDSQARRAMSRGSESDKELLRSEVARLSELLAGDRARGDSIKRARTGGRNEKGQR